MHDQVSMRELHRRADLTKELQPRQRVECVFVAITRDGFTFDVLHHEIGQAVFRGPAINQPGNVRVIQVGEDLALHHKALDDRIRVHAALDEL